MRCNLFVRAIFLIPMIAMPALGNAESAPELIYYIDLERGDVIEASRVEMAPNDFVRYWRRDGSGGYLATSRIQRIYDADGSDFTNVILQRRGRLGGPAASELPKYKSFCFRGCDKSSCGGFLLTEAAVLFPVSGHEPQQNLFGSTDLGAMVNVGDHSALGATAFWLSGSDYNRGGIRLRYRRWLKPHVSLEFAPGVVLDGNDTFHAPGFIGQVAINGGDLMSIVVEGSYDRYAYTPYTYVYPQGYVAGTTQTKSEKTLRVGLRGGSYVGTSAALLAAIGLAILASSFHGIGGSWGG